MRLDAALVDRGLASSRTEARTLIEADAVTVGGAPARKPATLVAASDDLVVRRPKRWASRGGEKLEGALDALAIPVEGRHALDAGASTGGFTDVLLARGAASITAVDVGYGQLLWRLREDPRVTVLDRTNVRHLEPDSLPRAPDLVVADLSFISLVLVLPALVRAAADTAEHLLMVKPQFEVGRERLTSSGVVRDPSAWADAVAGVARTGAELGLGTVGATPSPIRGPAGNVEIFLHLRRDGAASPDEVAAAAVARVDAASR